MQYRLVTNSKGERLWLPLLAGAAIISAPLWANNNNKCCQNQVQYYPYPMQYYPPYPINYSYYTPYSYPYPYSQTTNISV